MKLSFRAGAAALMLSAGILCGSCINVNKTLGESLIPDNQLYDIYTAEFPIEDIEQDMPDSLSGYNMYKFTFGALRDDTFGLTTRSTAFTLVPIADTLDFGKNAKFRQFHLSAVADSISYADPTQQYILQNINVYELESPLNLSKLNPEIKYNRKRITDGVPVYNGMDSLSIDFSKEFGEKYMGITAADMDTITNYTKKFPGIYITTDVPAGNGGRINMFRLPISVNSGTIYGSYAELKFTADYGERKQVDTSFLFYLGPMSLYDLSGVTSTTVAKQTQIAYDMTTHSSKGLQGKAEKTILMEGGKGLKPVIKAKSLRDKALEEILKHTDDPKSIVVSKASIILPFEFPDDYTEICKYPVAISPTCRIATDTSVTFASLTDSSVSTEDQGDINRSLCIYSPDITHHAQEFLKVEDDKKISNYDIWILAMANETVVAASSSSSSYDDDYYNSLMYYNYYNNMYNGYGYGGYGYGGYGGYGSYGYNSLYNNYYNYGLLQSMYSTTSSSSYSTTKQSMMDNHRYYKAVFNGPKAEKNVPMFRIVYAIPKSGE